MKTVDEIVAEIERRILENTAAEDLKQYRNTLNHAYIDILKFIRGEE